MSPYNAGVWNPGRSRAIPVRICAAPIAFAMLKTKSADPGTTVLVNAEGEQTDAVVCGLRFYNPVAPQASSARETGEST